MSRKDVTISTTSFIDSFDFSCSRSKTARYASWKYDLMTSTLREDRHWIPIKLESLLVNALNMSIHDTSLPYIAVICIRSKFVNYHLRLAARCNHFRPYTWVEIKTRATPQRRPCESIQICWEYPLPAQFFL